MLSEKTPLGLCSVLRRQSVQQFSWKHGPALGIMNASERTVKYIGIITSPCPWTGIIKIIFWYQVGSKHKAAMSRSCPTSGATSEQPDAEYWF